MRAKARRTQREAKRKGPRKLKSDPLLAAQNVYKVRLTTMIVQRIAASKIIVPVSQPIYISINNTREQVNFPKKKKKKEEA